MHTPQLADNLRRALLQAAIEGKLSERQADDGHARDLLKQIQAEKAALVKAGRLKKSKALPEIGEDEKPFTIPENWVWVRLGEVIFLKSGQDLTPSEYSSTADGIPYITGASHFNNGQLNISRWTKFPRSVAEKGSLLFTCKGTVGEMAFLQEEKAHIARQVMAITSVGNKVELAFIKIILQSYVTQIKAGAKSMIPGIGRDDLLLLLIPLPPLAEQARIVAKLDALLAETDALKAQETTLADVQKNFPKMLRASLLQAAIEGKLTERESGDGHAQELLAAIQAEKTALIKAGRLKKSKGLPEIDDDEKPFAIPENWVWVRLGEIAQINPRNKADDETVAAFVPMNLLNGGFQNSFSFEERAWKAIKKGYTHFAENDVVIAKITPCFQNRKSAVMRGLPNKIGAGTTELHVLRPYSEKVMPEYLLLIAKNAAFISDGVANFTGTAGQQRVSSTFVENYPIPLPPLAEQVRIVAKLDALLAQIEPLENLS
ncbi:restriction endonuclease subunit S [Neisseria shayeganii]|uniref:Restriction endonuclease subunit S n=1 Tax=Neisseria shayeganii TaxID=607712 RepID=A0A7D7N5T8_9NEIS|nr:restriction endonuclease subunit S [Neisseria shayeganii]QMT40363.1 restriction endonuclease subunit S [Neisseria shayeganii]